MHPPLHRRAVGHGGQFFQGFVGAAAHHPVLGNYLDLLEAFYAGRHKLDCPGDSSCNVGTRLLYEAYEQWGGKGQLLLESWKQAVPAVNKQVPSQAGIGCCCDVLVYDPTTLIAPFYSRFPGHTWFCVAKELVDGIPEDRRVVLLGESTHGTEEFYRVREAVTKWLVEERGFTAVLFEADWPAMEIANEYSRRQRGSPYQHKS